MDKKPLIGGSLLAVFLLILGSLSNVVGFQSVKSLENHAPDAPDIIGPNQNLKLGISYVFTFFTIDPDGDNVSYVIDWGDGNITGWVGPYKSGQEIHFAHTWTKKDNVVMKAKAKDLPFENESDWTMYPIRWSYSLSPQINHQNTFNNKVSKRELLFQTIVDIANNKEIQRIVLKSEMSRGIFPPSEIPVITKDQLRPMYILGMILSRFISISRMQAIAGKYQFDNQNTQKEISAVIEKDTIIKSEITQLKDSECDCKNDSMVTWDFPVICKVLLYIAGIFGIFPYVFFPIWGSAFFIAIILECYWTLP